MKRIFTVAVLATIVMATIFVACKKDQGASLSRSYNHTTAAKYSAQYKPIDFSAADLGALHNQCITTAYNSINFGSATLQQDLVNNFVNTNFDPTPLGMSKSEFVSKLRAHNDYMGACNYDLRRETNSSLSDAVRPYVYQVLDACDNLTSLEDFNSKTDQILTTAQETLYDADLDILKATVIVAKSSAHLWAPTAMGGDGLFDQLITKTKPYNVSVCARGWRGALLGDIGALAGSFTKIGIMGAIGMEIPGANVAILVGLGIDAAIGSGCGALW